MGIALGVLAVFAFFGPGIGQGEEDGSTYILLAAALAFVFMGSLVMSRVPGHRVGWVLTANGMLLVVSGVAVGFAGQGWVFGGAISYWMWTSWFISVGFLVLWFPTGRVPSPRWRWVQGLGGLFVGLVGIMGLFAERLCVEGSDGQCDVWVDNPIGIPGVPNPEYGAISTPILAIMVVFLALAVASLAVRLLKAKGVERQQLKWLAIDAIFFVAWMLVPEQVMPIWLNNLLLGVAVVGLPVSISLAVLRYRALRHRPNLLPDRLVCHRGRLARGDIRVGPGRAHLHARHGVSPGRRRRHLGRRRIVQSSAETRPGVGRPPIQPLPLRRTAGHR